MAVETIGEAYSLGMARYSALRSQQGARAQLQIRVGSAPTGRSWIWRLPAGRVRAVEHFPLSRLESRLRCPRCGSRSMVVMGA